MSELLYAREKARDVELNPMKRAQGLYSKAVFQLSISKGEIQCGKKCVWSVLNCGAERSILMSQLGVIELCSEWKE